MEQVGFIGAVDKKDLLIACTAVLNYLGKKTLIVDATSMQRFRYVVPMTSSMPQVTYVKNFEIADNMKDITVERALEDGHEVIKIQTPCMLTAIKELNTPRYMNIAGIYNPDKKITVWNAADIEVDLTTVGLKASPTNVFRSFTPKPKGKGMMLAGDTEKDLAKDLLIRLKDKHVI